jgi:peptidoglycan/LPS O-acetylase OafA/YrhL
MPLDILPISKARTLSTASARETGVRSTPNVVPFQHEPALDGVRGLAILMVLAVHGFSFIEGGLLGVDVFFTLSGFLITRLIVQEISANGKLNVKNFYIRRGLRLVPALLVSILFTCAVRLFGDPLATRMDVVIPAVLLYVANWVPVVSSYTLGLFSPFWSLAIEEQFYLLWPWIVRRLPKRQFAAIALPGVIILTILLRTILSLNPFRGLDDVTLLRSDGLLLGAWAAIVHAYAGTPSWIASRRAGWSSIALLLLQALLVCKFPENHTARSLAYAFTGLATAFLILHVLSPKPSLLKRALCQPGLLILGRVSYGVYLYHFPVFQIVQARHFALILEVLLETSITAVVVAASWRFVEIPALKLKRRFSHHSS